MDIEKKTLVYTFIGLLYLITVVGSQAGSDIDKLLFGGYDKDSHPDLVVESESFGAASGDLHNFVYSGHYISKTAALANENEVHEGLFFLRLGNDNFLEKKYNRVPVNSSIKVTAFNSIFSPSVNQSSYCEALNMTVKQNGNILETLDVEETSTLEKFKVKPHPSNSESSITLTISPNKKCGSIPQILGIDKFYLEEPPGAKPAGLVNQILHIIPV